MKSPENALSFIRTRVRPLLLGLCVGVLCTALLLLLAALLIRSVDIPRAAVTPLAYAAAGLGAFFAGLTASRIARQNGLVMGAVCGLVLFFVILLAGCFIADDTGSAPAWVKPLLLTAAGAVGGVLGVNRRKR